MDHWEYAKVLGNQLSVTEREAVRGALKTLEGAGVFVINALYDAAERNEGAGFTGTALAQKAQWRMLCEVEGGTEPRALGVEA